MRFLRHSAEQAGTAYVLHAPYAQDRLTLLARRPADFVVSPPAETDVWAVVVDLGLEYYLLSLYVFADGSIAVYGSGGIHATGLRGATHVRGAAAILLEEAEATAGDLPAVESVEALPLPSRGHVQIVVRTRNGDRGATFALPVRRLALARFAGTALAVIELARDAIAGGFEPAEPGDFLYVFTPEYRQMRRTLLDLAPELPPESRPPISGVAVEFAESAVVTSLFVFADGSTSLFSSDGSVAQGLSRVAGMATAAERLLEAVGAALSAFVPAESVPAPQPGIVQFVARPTALGEGHGDRLVAAASLAELRDPGHPLAVAFAAAGEIRSLALSGSEAP